MRVLVVHIGGTNVKVLATGKRTPRKIPSGAKLTPRKMVSEIKTLAAEWKYDAVTVGYPGPVRDGRILAEPKNLSRGWVKFDFRAAFGRPVKIINDAAMQALGSHKRGLLLFLGLGTSLGAALVTDGVVIPMELAHLPFRDGTYEEYLGVKALKRLGRKKWQRHVALAAARMAESIRPDDLVLGGGNAKKLKNLPKGCRVGDNSDAFTGGFRLWDKASTTRRPAPTRSRRES